MDIKNKRIQTEVNRIVKDSLSDGYLPTSIDVTTRLSRYIHEMNLDGPVYEYRNTFNDFAVSLLEDSVADVSTDINMAMSSTIDIYEELDRMVDRFDVEKKKYDYWISSLESELYNMTSQYATNGYTEVFVENIRDMGNFDTAKSDCDINLVAGDVTLKKLEDRLYSGKRSVTAESADQLKTNGDIEDFIDRKGSYWQGIVKKPTQDGAHVDIMVDFKDQVSINKVEMQLPLLKPSSVTVSTSSDFNNWVIQQRETVRSSLVANMQGSFRHMRIRIEKEEADKFMLGTYEYHFLLDTILFYTINYKTQSTLYTKPISFNSNINAISIRDEAIIPNSTDIRYYVATNSETPRWRRITPLNRQSQEAGSSVTFNTIEKNRFKDLSMKTELSKDNYKVATAMSQDILAIDEIKDLDITRSQLYKGIGQWKVEKIHSIESTNIPLDKSTFISGKSEIQTSYRDIALGRIMSEEKFTSTCAVKFTAAIDCPKGTRPKSYQLSANYPISIYLNGINIYSGTPTRGTQVTYPFKEKKNILEIIVNVNEMNIDDEVPYALVSANLNMDISKFSNQAYGHPEPLEEVSYFNLRYNSHKRKNVYSIRKLGDTHEVLIKDEDLSIRYRLYYDYVAKEERELLLKAELSREFKDVNTTPRIRKIEILNI